MIKVADIIEIQTGPLVYSLEITIPLSLKYGFKDINNIHRAQQFKRYIYIKIDRMGIWFQLTLRNVYGKWLYSTKFSHEYFKNNNK